MPSLRFARFVRFGGDNEATLIFATRNNPFRLPDIGKRVSKEQILPSIAKKRDSKNEVLRIRIVETRERERERLEARTEEVRIDNIAENERQIEIGVKRSVALSLSGILGAADRDGRYFFFSLHTAVT